MRLPPAPEKPILLVDDCDAHCALTEHALRKVRPATRCVRLNSGEAAIRHLDTRHEAHLPPELLLLDWRMPGRSGGAEVLSWARAQPHLRRLPILILSGVGLPEDRRRAAELGADGYLIKPSHLDGYDTLARQLDRWRRQFAATLPPTDAAPPPPAARREEALRRWRHRARALGGLMRRIVRRGKEKAAPGSPEYVETTTDQLTLDLVRLCRAQGILPRDILHEPAGGFPPARAQQRRTVLRGLARRGWDTHELAEVFPLSPAAISLLVRRKG